MDRQDINYGVDFERAREHLDAEAGRLFRTYLAAKKSGTPEDIEQAIAGYEAAQRRAQARAVEAHVRDARTERGAIVRVERRRRVERLEAEAERRFHVLEGEAVHHARAHAARGRPEGRLAQARPVLGRDVGQQRDADVRAPVVDEVRSGEPLHVEGDARR